MFMRMTIAILLIMISNHGIFGYCSESLIVSSNNDFSISAFSLPDTKSIRVAKILDGKPFLGVYGGFPFKLEWQALSDASPQRVILATSVGVKYEMTNAKTIQLVCDFPVRYDVIVIAKYADGRTSACSFWIGPAWRVSDKGQIPSEVPEAICPKDQDEGIQECLDYWWANLPLKSPK